MRLLLLFSCLPLMVLAQVELDHVKAYCKKENIHLYKYHGVFDSDSSKASPIFQVSNGFYLVGDIQSMDKRTGGTGKRITHTVILFIDNAGKENWRLIVPPHFDHLETMSVLLNSRKELFVFIKEYGPERTPGLTRIMKLNEHGDILGNTFLGETFHLKAPHPSEITLLEDGLKMKITGHIYPTLASVESSSEHHWTAVFNTIDMEIDMETIGEKIIWK